MVDKVFDLIVALRRRGCPFCWWSRTSGSRWKSPIAQACLRGGSIALSGSAEELASSDLVRQAYLECTDMLLQHVVNAISLGGIYALLALGLAIVFSIVGLINFAHGELMTIAGYSTLGALLFGVPFPAAVLIAIGDDCAGGDGDGADRVSPDAWCAVSRACC